MSVNYTKVDETSAEVVTLATQMNVPAKTVAQMINQDRYRKEYNRQHNRQLSLLRKALREHPELKEVK